MSDYASRLKKLIKNNLVVAKKGKSVDDELPYTWQKSVQGVLSELNDLATQHERLVELLQESVLKPLDETIRTSKDSRKRVMNDVMTAEVKYKQSKKQLDAMQERYKKAYGAAVQSEQNYERAERDVNLSRANVDKIKAEMMRKKQECDDAKKDYAAQFERTNEDQRVHFEENIPSLMNQLEDLETKRIMQFRDCLSHANDAEKDVLKIMVKCTDVIDAKVAIVDARRDNQFALDTLKTGYHPPEPFQFEELSASNIGSTAPPNRQGAKPPVELQKGFRELPPNQQKNEVNKKLNQLRDEHVKKIKELDGVQKLEQSYRQNPKLGNADMLRDQMVVINKQIEALNAEIREYEGYLQEAEARMDRGAQRNTLTDGAIQKAPVTAPSSTESRMTMTPISTNIGGSQAASPTHSQPIRAQSTVDDDWDDQLQPIGKAVALYAYEANDASALSIQVNEQLSIIEADSQNSGWTRVRRTTTADEGYVPTAYLKIDLF